MHAHLNGPRENNMLPKQRAKRKKTLHRKRQQWGFWDITGQIAITRFDKLDFRACGRLFSQRIAFGQWCPRALIAS
jgi:hypothetical protein